MALRNQSAVADKTIVVKSSLWYCLFPLILCLIATASSVASAAPAVSVVAINGRTVPCQPPGIWQQDTVYLPDEFLRRFLGIEVIKDAETSSWLLRAYGKTLRVRPEETVCRLGYEVLETSAAPQLRQEHLYIPLGLVTEVFAISLAKDEELEPGGDVQLSVARADVTDVRCGSHPDRARIVIDLTGPATYLWGIEDSTVLVDIAGRPQASEGQSRLRLLTFDDELVTRVSQSVTADGFHRIVISHNSPGPAHIFTLTGPDRIVVDIPRPTPPTPTEPDTEPSQLQPKPLRWQVRNFGTPRGPVQVYVLKVAPQEVRPALAGVTVHQRRSVLSIAGREGAQAAVNGGFYARQGLPLGLVMIDREWIRPPLLRRTALGITSDGEVLMDNLSFDGRLYFKGHGYLQLDGLNEGHTDTDGVAVYNKWWGRQLIGSNSCTRLAVSASAGDGELGTGNSDGTEAADNEAQEEGDGQDSGLSYCCQGVVVAKASDGDAVEIPPNGFVISGRGKHAELLARIEPGEQVTLKLNTKPAWEEVYHALGAGPRLVRDGKISITARAERFRQDVTKGICPRTAVGVTKQGELLLVAVEPAPGSAARGMSLEEVATTMLKLGALQAMNLDGGGSTTVVEGDRVLNHPADGWLRPVSNALVVIAPPQQPASNE